MVKTKTKLSFLLTFVLIFQLLIPFINVQAAGTVAAPTNLIATKFNYNDVQLKWDAVSNGGYGVDGYRVYKITNGEKVFVKQITTTQYYFSNLSEGTQTFAITAVSGATESDLSSLVTVDIMFPDMQPPTGLKSILYNENDLLLSWDASPNATGYNIYQIVNGERKLIVTTDKRSRYFSNLPEGEYVYEVTSYSDRFGESEQSSKITVSVVHPDMQPPANLTSTFYNGNDVSLTWKESAYATGYNVYQLVNGQKKFIATTTSKSRYFSNLPEGEYAYEVTSYSDRFGESEQSSKITVSVVHPDMQPPADLTSTFYNGNDVLLTWKESAYATSYNIYQITNGERKLVTTTTGKTKYFANLPEGEYVYEVTSYSDRFGESEQSSKITLNMKHPVMQAPPSLKSEIYNGNDVLLTWQESPYATLYNIFQVVNGEKKLVATTDKKSRYFSYLPEGNYVYEVSSFSDRFGESKETSKVSVNIVYPKMHPPAAQLTVDNYTNATIRWAKTDNADKYNIYELVNGEAVLLKTVTSTSYYVPNIKEGTHQYVVTSVSDRFGESAYSNTVVAEIGPKLEAPASSYATVEEDKVTLSWSPVQDAASYNVYEVVDEELKLVGTTTTPSLTIENLQAGDYEYRIVPVTPGGTESKNYSTVNIQRGEFDTTAPVTTSNVKDAWNKEDFTVQLTATDDQSGVDKTYYSINGSEFVEGTSFTVSEEKVHTISFYSVDKAGNKEEVKTVDLKLDKTAPVTTSDVKDLWYKKEVEVQLTAIDDQSGVEKTFYSVDDLAYVEGTSVAISGEGIHKVSFYSVDKAGNVEKTKTVEVKVDKQAPVTTSDVENKWYTESVPVKLTATDGLSGVAKTFYSINGSDFTEGTKFTVEKEGIHKVSFYSMDKAGNVEDVKTVEVEIDKTVPETTSNVEDKWYTEAVQVELTAKDEVSGVDKTFYSIDGSEYKEGTTFTVEDAGIHKVSFYSVDKAGNVEEAKTAEVKIDKQAPVTTSNVEDKWYTEAVEVQLTATDNLSGVDKTFYSVNGSDFTEGTAFTVENEGIHEVSFYSVDKAGNVEKTNTVKVNIDTMAPETASNVEDKWYTEAAQIQLTAKDEVSGVEKNFYSIDGSEYKEGTTFTVESEGIHEVSFYSVDKAGNVEEVKTVEVKIDKKTPVTTSNVEDKWYTEAVQVQLTAADELSGVDKTFYSINGSEYKEGTEFTLEAGIHEVSFYSVDKAGNVEEAKTVTVKIDETAPVTTSNAEVKWYKDKVQVQLTATDDLSGVDKTFYSINGSEFAEGTEFTLENEGIHAISFYSIDKAGNVEEVKTAEVKIDKTAPTVETEFTEEVALGAAMPLTYTASDNLSGVASQTVTINGQPALGNSVTFDKPGFYNIEITVTDHAGWTTTEKKMVTVYLPVELEVLPRIIKENKGEFTVKATLPKGYSPEGFDLSTVKLNGVSALSGSKGLVQQSKKGQFKFEREDFVWNEKEVELEFRAMVNGIPVLGRTTVEVTPDKKKPCVFIDYLKEYKKPECDYKYYFNICDLYRFLFTCND